MSSTRKAELSQRNSPSVFTVFLLLISFGSLLLAQEDATGPVAEPDEFASREALEQAQEILNDSPWARRQTITRVIPGVESGELWRERAFQSLLRTSPYGKASSRSVSDSESPIGWRDFFRRILDGARGTQTFGVISAAERAREIEVALKYYF